MARYDIGAQKRVLLRSLVALSQPRQDLKEMHGNASCSFSSVSWCVLHLEQIHGGNGSDFAPPRLALHFLNASLAHDLACQQAKHEQDQTSSTSSMAKPVWSRQGQDICTRANLQWSASGFSKEPVNIAKCKIPMSQILSSEHRIPSNLHLGVFWNGGSLKLWVSISISIPKLSNFGWFGDTLIVWNPHLWMYPPLWWKLFGCGTIALRPRHVSSSLMHFLMMSMASKLCIEHSSHFWGNTEG